MVMVSDEKLPWPAKFEKFKVLATLFVGLATEDVEEFFAFTFKKFGIHLLVKYMVGHLRYQPAKLVGIFGYDFLYRPVIEFELAGLDVLADIGKIPAEVYALLTPDIRKKCLAIATTLVDQREEITRHDIRSVVQLMQEILPDPLRPYVHVPFTSYNPIATAMSLSFLRAYQQCIAPDIRQTIMILSALARKHANTLMIGRTHLKHAVPITAGFWLANILHRIVYCSKKIDEAAAGLVGNAAGACGAHNAEVALELDKLCGDTPLDVRVLAKLGLDKAPISGQIPPPEPVSAFLSACKEAAQAFGQLGEDWRHLMMDEIGEVSESAEPGAVFSSTMAGKVNPRWSEALAGMAKLAKWAFNLVEDCANSLLQRDLVDTAPYRFFPLTIIFLAQQLQYLLKPSRKTKKPILEGFVVNPEVCLRNFNVRSYRVMGELLYLSLQMYGLKGDGHKMVNDVLMPMSDKTEKPLIDSAIELSAKDPNLAAAIANMPDRLKLILRDPKQYIGNAPESALERARVAEEYAATAPYAKAA